MTMTFEMYLDFDGNLAIGQTNKAGKTLFFNVEIKRGYNTNDHDLDDCEDEGEYFEKLKQAIADKFNLKQY
jgi:hypothetical protein